MGKIHKNLYQYEIPFCIFVEIVSSVVLIYGISTKNTLATRIAIAVGFCGAIGVILTVRNTARLANKLGEETREFLASLKKL